MVGSERFSTVIDVTLGTQTILVNQTATDATTVSATTESSGLNGTGCDVELYQSNRDSTAAGDQKAQIGTTINCTPTVNQTNAGGAMNCDYLFIEFEPNDATTGTITVSITFK